MSSGEHPDLWPPILSSSSSSSSSSSVTDRKTVSLSGMACDE